MTASPALVEGKSSSAVSGNLPPAEALSRLLAGTGLTFRFVSATGVTLERAPETTEGTVQLGPVRVEGDSGTQGDIFASATSDPLASEETKSYAAKASASTLRLPLSLRQTPQSVTVITRRQIEEQNLQTIASVLEQTPGITVNRENSEGYSFYSRGFAIEGFQVDGVPSLSSGGGNVRDNYSIADSAIYDRIEVLKGATGLVNGAGYPSGVINFIRKRPTREFRVQGMIGAGSWNNYRAELDVGGPLSSRGNVRARLFGAYQDQDSFIDYFGVRQKTLYGIVEVDLGASTTLSLGGDYQDNNARATTNSQLPAFYSDGSVVTFPRHMNAADKWAYRDQTTRRVFIGLDHKFDDRWQIKATGSWRKYSSRELIAGLGMDAVVDVTTHSIDHGFYVGGVSLFNTDSKEKGVDLQLSGSFDLLGRSHDLILGYNFAKTNAESNRYDGDTDPSIPDIFRWDNNATQPARYDYWLTFNIHSKQHIAFASTVLRLTDRLSLIAGGRLNWYEWSLRSKFAPGFGGLFSSEVDRKFIPYAGMTFDLDDHHSLYASYTDIFKPQAYNFDRTGRQLDPLTGKNYEIGIKGEYLGGLLTASLAGFWITQDNFAELDPSGASTPTGDTAYIAVQGVTTKGIEAELAGELLPGWQVHGGYTYRQSHDRNDQQVSSIQPEHLFKLATSYRFDGALEGLVVGGNLLWQSGTYFEMDVGSSTARFNQDGYAIVGLTGSYDINDNLKMSLSVNNLLDKHYYSGIGNYHTVFYGSPRNFFVSLRGRF
ncbi:MAG: TonB-dependent siderophore receptor [Sphingobium sp.]